MDKSLWRDGLPRIGDRRWEEASKRGVSIRQVMAETEQRRQMELDHIEALAENAAHDAATAAARPLTPAYLTAWADRPRQMPRTLRNQISHARSAIRVPPRRHA